MSSISKLGFFFLSLIFLQLFNSCTVSKNFKHYVYLSDTVRSSHLTVVQPPTPKLRVGDRIQITVTALNLSAAQAFNQGGGQLVGGIAGGGSVGGGVGVSLNRPSGSMSTIRMMRRSTFMAL